MAMAATTMPQPVYAHHGRSSYIIISHASWEQIYHIMHRVGAQDLKLLRKDMTKRCFRVGIEKTPRPHYFATNNVRKSTQVQSAQQTVHDNIIGGIFGKRVEAWEETMRLMPEMHFQGVCIILPMRLSNVILKESV
jgi:hypothetical protein